MDVKQLLFKRISYKSIKYKPTDIPVVGGIAKCLRTDYYDKSYLTEGKYYLIKDYIFEGDPSLMGDDGYPCGLHECFGKPLYGKGASFQYYAPIYNKVNEFMIFSKILKNMEERE